MLEAYSRRNRHPWGNDPDLVKLIKTYCIMAKLRSKHCSNHNDRIYQVPKTKEHLSKGMFNLRHLPYFALVPIFP